MKILIQTPLKNEEIKALLCSQPHEGITFEFTGKQGIGLVFEVTGGSLEQALALAKATIKETGWGKVLYFSAIAGY